MRPTAILLVTLLSMLLTNCGNKNTPAPTALQQEINQIIKRFPNNPSMGIIIKNLSRDKVLFQLNPTRTFVPASTTKTITATVALKYLGPNYRFKTTLARTGNIDGSTLQGDIYLSFSGDPSFKLKNLNQLLLNLKQQHIKKIAGNIIINSGYFPNNKPGIGYMWDDLNFCYSAPSTAVVLNHNCFHFQMHPNTHMGDAAVINSRHGFNFTPIENNVLTEPNNIKNCPINMDVSNTNQYHIYGCIRHQAAPYTFDVAVHNPHYLLRQTIEKFLSTNKITLNGQVHFTNQTIKTSLIATHHSKPLAHLIKHMLKTSDNLYANILFKTVGAKFMNGQATWKNGAKANQKLLKQMNIDTQDTRIVDGSGLSRYNRFSPKLLLQILEYNYHNKKFGHAFRNALSIAGTDGTLKNFNLPQSDAELQAKTGDMFAITSLAGYLTTVNHQQVAVVIMINGIDKSRAYFKLAHQILSVLK